MYIVEVSYGMEAYQHERKEFNDYDVALKYYNEWVQKKPISAKMYQQLKSYSIFD